MIVCVSMSTDCIEKLHLFIWQLWHICKPNVGQVSPKSTSCLIDKATENFSNNKSIEQ